MAFHHFTSRERAMIEFRRVLRRDGLVCVRNSTRDRGSPYERFFPNYRGALDQLPSTAEIAGSFVAGGFELHLHEVVDHVMALGLNELAEKASYRADSTLLRLSDDDFQQGLAAICAAAGASDGPVTIGIDLFVFG
jgi:ubiquinone/menaquinone biosynthesis C-methylase UbiE